VLLGIGIAPIIGAVFFQVAREIVKNIDAINKLELMTSSWMVSAT